MHFSAALLLVSIGAVAGALNWSVQDADGKTCLVFAAETITGKLNAKQLDNTTVPISFAINATQKTSGNCAATFGGAPANTLEVEFFPDGVVPTSATEGQPWKLTLVFTAGENPVFKLADYSLETTPIAAYNTSTEHFDKADTADLDIQASGINGFKCSTSGLALSSDSTLTLKDTRVIAHAKLDGKDFPASQTFEQCQLDSRTSDIVPIVVGACLAGLVVVVLVAYLVGRARARRQGYASV